jgi:hypothetical protein
MKMCANFYQNKQYSYDYDRVENCRTHNMQYHDIFISYHVALEGKSHIHSTVCRPFLQM